MFPAETFRHTLGRLAGILDRLGVRFHLTGGVSTIAYGEPRMTQDVDLVVDPRGLTARLDAALSKLVWISKGSHKSRRDLRQIMRRANAAEQKIVERGAIDLGLAGLLADVLAESDVIGP